MTNGVIVATNRKLVAVQIAPRQDSSVTGGWSVTRRLKSALQGPQDNFAKRQFSQNRQRKNPVSDRARATSPTSPQATNRSMAGAESAE